MKTGKNMQIFILKDLKMKKKNIALSFFVMEICAGTCNSNTTNKKYIFLELYKMSS